MNLLVNSLKAKIADLAKTEKGLENARVSYKVNAHGEMVIALIIPPRYPGEWDPPERSPRGYRPTR